jgi:hypothetical protein
MLVPPPLPEHAVDERVDHHVAALDPELREEALDPVSGLADQNSARNRLVLRGILAEHEHSCTSVQAPAVEDRPPLEPEILRRIHARAGDVFAKTPERLLGISDVECAHG